MIADLCDGRHVGASRRPRRGVGLRAPPATFRAPVRTLDERAARQAKGSRMYKLYYSPGTASLPVHLALIELGVPHELYKVDLDGGEQRSPGYLALNPNAVVPTL